MNHNESNSSAGGIVAAGGRSLARQPLDLIRRGLDYAEFSSATALIDLGKSLTSTLELDKLLCTMMDNMDRGLHPDRWALLLFDDAAEELHFELVIGEDGERLADVRIKPGQGLAGWVAQHGESIVVPDVTKDVRFVSDEDEKTKAGINSLVVIPIRFDDRCLGVIRLVNYIGPDGITPAKLTWLEAFADFAAIGLENARNVKRIHELTITDDLSSLYNYRYLHQMLTKEIERSQRYSYTFCILCMNLPELSDLRNSFGQAKFRRAVAQLGTAFKTGLRLIDFCFYDGHTEFAFLLPQTSKENGRIAAENLRGFVDDTSWLKDEQRPLRLYADIACAAFPDDGTSATDLLRVIDEGLYRLRTRRRANQESHPISNE